MPSASYLAADGWNWHKLSDFRKSPALCYRKHVVRGVTERRTQAMAFGTAFHSRTLEGIEGFARDCVVVPDEHLTPSGEVSTKKESRAWAERHAGKVLLSPGDAAMIETLSRRVHANPHAAALLAGAEMEKEIFSYCPITGLPLKCSIDVKCADGVSVCDLKSCDDIDTFVHDIATWGYVDQVAFYARLAGRSVGWLIAAEKREPHRVAVYRIAPALMEAARFRMDGDLLRLSACLNTDEWPSDPAAVIELAELPN